MKEIGKLKVVDGKPVIEVNDKDALAEINKNGGHLEIGYTIKKVKDGEVIDADLLEISIVPAEQPQLIETPKTMLDWFVENGIDHISVDVPYSSGAGLQTVYANLKMNESTKRAEFTYNAITDEGEPWNQDGYEDISAEDGKVFGEYVTKIQEVLAKPYPFFGDGNDF